VVFIKAMV